MRKVAISLTGMVLLSALPAQANDVHQTKCKGNSGACIEEAQRVCGGDFQFMSAQALFLSRNVGVGKFPSGTLFLSRRLATHERADAIDQSSNGLKWFRQDIVRANSARLRFVERLERANQQQDGDVFELLMCFDVFTNLVTVR